MPEHMKRMADEGRHASNQNYPAAKPIVEPPQHVGTCAIKTWREIAPEDTCALLLGESCDHKTL